MELIEKKPKILAIIQARMGSTRLPGKVLSDVAGRPLILRALNQFRASKLVDQFVIAIPAGIKDDHLSEYLSGIGIEVFRGSSHDVLDRYYQTAIRYKASVIVRLTADCPLHSGDTIDEVIAAFLDRKVDYAANRMPYSRPDGQDVEVFKFDTLKLASNLATSKADREHVTPWMIRNENVSRLIVKHQDDGMCSASKMRWTVDYPDDLEFVSEVWRLLDKRSSKTHNYYEILRVINTMDEIKSSKIPNEGYFKSIYDEANSEFALPLNISKSSELAAASELLIPGGAQTYSKSWKQHIRGVSPEFLDYGQGANVFDVDGNEYVDLIQGLLPNILGYAHPEVDKSAYDRARRGHSFSMAHPLEIELAKRLVDIIPCAEMVRFGKNGSDATAGAIRVARAYTGKERVAVCGYHGWQDWYIGSTSRHIGVPKCVRELAHPFSYNNLDELDGLLSQYPGEFAAVIMEPFNFYWPADGYLEGVKKLAHKHKALLIFDEICSGFHFGLGGAQKLFGVTPDMACFGKAMGNGYPISAIVGRKDVMKVFDDAFVSFTFAGDVSAMAASLTVLDILQHTDAYEKMNAAGEQLFNGIKVFAKLSKLENFIISGHHNWPIFSFKEAGQQNEDLGAKALWLQEVTRRGVLVIATHNISAALKQKDVDKVLSAYAHAFKVLQLVRDKNLNPIDFLQGNPPAAAFRARG